MIAGRLESRAFARRGDHVRESKPHAPFESGMARRYLTISRVPNRKRAAPCDATGDLPLFILPQRLCAMNSVVTRD